MAESRPPGSGTPSCDGGVIAVHLGSLLEDVDGATADRIHEFFSRLGIRDRRPAQPPAQPPAEVPVGDGNSNVYEIQTGSVGKGMLIVNRKFKKLPELKPASVDGTFLEAALTWYMGLDPGHIMKKTNLQSGEIKNAFRTAATWDYKGVDFFVCAIVSHGDKDRVYGTDFNRDSDGGAVKVNDIVKIISNIKDLRGKPKIFIFEGNRGDQTDQGLDVTAPVADQTDLNRSTNSSIPRHARDLDSQTHQSIRPGSRFRIPCGADVLLVYATPEGYQAHQDMSGSWFVRSLWESMAKESPALDFLTLLTRTNNRMSHREGSEGPGTRVKQASAFASTLMKDLHFPHSRFGGSGDVRDGPRYKMNGKGKALILNNKVFDRRLRLSERNGTFQDQAKIELFLHGLEFDVTKKRNLKATEMKEALTEAAGADYSDYDCFVCFILTHGAGSGMIYGTDGSLDLNSLISAFNKNPFLGGKPKLFFVQACRGEHFNEGDELMQRERRDGPNHGDEHGHSCPTDSHSLPAEADFFIAYSTVPGERAWRNEVRGSWFITALIDNLKKNKRWDLAKILTRVNSQVGTHFKSSGSEKPEYNDLKQMPSFVSRLTKDFYFSTREDN